jgi:RimJ/RimL family protein N-acetyltransferase
LGFAFDEMNLHRIQLSVYEFNQRAMRCYEKCGFRHEGRAREAFYREGKYHDSLLMAILRQEFAGQDVASEETQD